VDLLIKHSYRTESRLVRLALATCCFALLVVGKTDGQAVQATDDPRTGRSTIGVGGLGTPVTGTPIPATTPPTTTQGDIDISSPRRMDATQARLPSRAVAPATLTEFQQVVAASTGRVLPIFGAGLFNTVPSTFAPVDNIPVTPDYLIGPGDELQVQIWGQVNQHGSFVVDRTGSISLPQVGTVHVAGLQFSQLSDFLKSQLGRVYRNFDLNTNLGQLRSIQVFVVGQARQPGSYTIGSLSTLLNALFASGGPLPQGSLRDIQVKRGNETITHFDLYDLLLHGDKSKDVRLEPGDVIFIPDVGPQVAVLGSVTTPAIYELQHEKAFTEVIALAGGLTNVAASSHARVERIYNHAQRSEMDVDLTTGDSPSVQNGDIVSVNSIVDRFKNAVTLRGNVANPGRYEWHQGMRVSDLIPNQEMLVTRNYYQRQDLLGQNSQDYYLQQNTQDYPRQNNQDYPRQSNQDARAGQNNQDYRGPLPQGSLGLQTGTASDAAAADRSSSDTANSKGNSVGTALTAGNRNFSATNDVILSAPDIDWEYAVIERQNQSTLKTSLVPFNLGKVVLDRDKSQDIELLDGDVVTIFSNADIRVPSVQQTKVVKLEGEFVASGLYSVLPGETLRQLLIRAGGITPDAYLYASEFTRDSVRRVERQRIVEYADTLEAEIAARSASLASSAVTDRDAAAAQASAVEARSTLARLRQTQPTGRIVFQLKPDASNISSIPDLSLEDGDRFVVPKIPSNVSVQGQVYNANAFVYQKGKRVKDYLYLAGGPDRNADRKREFILRADGSVVSHQYSSFGQRTLFANRDFEDVLLLPGDTVVVPPTIEKGSLLRNLTNIATIVGGLGLGVAAINVLK
jgi:polysaccharide export outer membrane protein